MADKANNNANILVVGAGMMASALSFPLIENNNNLCIAGTPLDNDIISRARIDGYHITLKRQLPDGIDFCYTDEVPEKIKKADLLICGVSSFGIDWFCENIIPLIPDDLPVLAVTKGMLNTSGGGLISYPEYMKAYAEMLCKHISFNAIGGPCTSYELADGDFSCVTFCGEDIEQLRYFKSLFETEYYNISLSTDIRGVECAVAMKNAYALAVSLTVGMSFKKEGKELQHYNSQAAMFGQSVKEMIKLLELFEGDPSNIVLGAGDLYVTIFGGRTRKIGVLLGMGESFDDAMNTLAGITLESVVISKRTAKAVKELIALGKVNRVDFPVLLHIDELIKDGKPLNIPWKSFETETIL